MMLRILAALGSKPAGPPLPAAGVLSLTGYAPTVLLSNSPNIATGAGTLSLTGYAPTLFRQDTIRPTAGALGLTGAQPTVTLRDGRQPAAGALALAGYQPTVTQQTPRLPIAGALALTGAAPTVVQQAIRQPTAGTLSLTGYAPTLLRQDTIRPAAGALGLTGYAPTVSNAAPFTVLVDDQTTLTDSVLNGDTAYIDVSINRNGTMTIKQGQFGSDVDITNNWGRPTSTTVGDGYEARLTINSGQSPDSGSSANGSWIAISTLRRWVWTRTAVGSSFIDATLEVRAAGGSTLDSGAIAGDLNVDP
jgi:hypothetical protein